MKIALICPYPFSRPGGVQEHIRCLSSQLKKKSFTVKIISPMNLTTALKLKPPFLEPNPDLYYIGGVIDLPILSTQASVNYSLPYFNPIKKVLKKEKFDLIHLHSPQIPILSWQFLRSFKGPKIATFHSILEEDESRIFVKRFLPVAKHVIKHYLKRLDGAIAVSKAAALFSRKYYDGEFIIIPNGVDLSRFSPDLTKIKSFSDGYLNILFVGRIEERKGILYLLKVFKILKERFEKIRLIVVGNGPLLFEAKYFVKKNKVKDVFFEGRVSNEALPYYYKTADIFCSPATHGESFGIVLLEAMATGCPVVAYKNSGYKEVLKDLPSEFTPPPRSIKGLVKSLEILIKDKKRRKELEDWGLKEVKKYSWDKVGEEIVGFYGKVLNKKGK